MYDGTYRKRLHRLCQELPCKANLVSRLLPPTTCFSEKEKGHTFRREVNLKFKTESINVSAKSFFDLLRGAGRGIDLPQQGVCQALLLCLGPKWRLTKEKTNKGKSVLSTLP